MSSADGPNAKFPISGGELEPAAGARFASTSRRQRSPPCAAASASSSRVTCRRCNSSVSPRSSIDTSHCTPRHAASTCWNAGSMEDGAHQVGHRRVDGCEHLRQLWVRRRNDVRRDSLADQRVHAAGRVLRGRRRCGLPASPQAWACPSNRAMADAVPLVGCAAPRLPRRIGAAPRPSHRAGLRRRLRTSGGAGGACARRATGGRRTGRRPGYRDGNRRSTRIPGVRRRRRARVEWPARRAASRPSRLSTSTLAIFLSATRSRAGAPLPRKSPSTSTRRTGPLGRRGPPRSERPSVKSKRMANPLNRPDGTQARFTAAVTRGSTHSAGCGTHRKPTQPKREHRGVGTSRVLDALPRTGVESTLIDSPRSEIACAAPRRPSPCSPLTPQRSCPMQRPRSWSPSCRSLLMARPWSWWTPTAPSSRLALPSARRVERVQLAIANRQSGRGGLRTWRSVEALDPRVSRATRHDSVVLGGSSAAAPGECTEAHAPSDAPAAQADEPAVMPCIEADVDGRRVRLTAQDEIVLQCGSASVTLRRNGRVVIRGAYVETHSEGTNRIKGGQVQIN